MPTSRARWLAVRERPSRLVETVQPAWTRRLPIAEPIAPAETMAMAGVGIEEIHSSPPVMTSSPYLFPFEARHQGAETPHPRSLLPQEELVPTVALLRLSFGTPPFLPPLQMVLLLPQPFLAPPCRPSPPLINASSVGKPSAILARVASSTLPSFLSTPPLTSRRYLQVSRFPSGSMAEDAPGLNPTVDGATCAFAVQSLTPRTVVASFQLSLPSSGTIGTNTLIVQVQLSRSTPFRTSSLLPHYWIIAGVVDATEGEKEFF
ncbi:hypothetical protein EDD22DRAFT_1013759 [Suillus occidentalis]|nr:hypothetical protein EDD22DRAFT_1013759 [Suillus occidentalis]